MTDITKKIKLPAGIHRLSWMILGSIAAIVLTVPLALAQYRASIQGVVTDPQGRAIPGATLKLTDTSTNRTSTATSDSHGNYTFDALAADPYTLTATASGFAGKTLTGVRLIPEQPNTVNVQLAVGSTSEQVMVSASEVPAIDTTTASISGTITNNQIQHMPSFDRDVFRLIAMAPGTFGDEAQSNTGNAKNMPAENLSGPTASQSIFETENNPQVIGNGSQVNANNILIDGISTSSANWGGATVITPSEESVDYMKVSSNAYDAEFGRFSGNAVQITSRGGTNEYHGSLFFKADRPGLNAYQRWNGTSSVDPLNASLSPSGRGLDRDESDFNQFGGSVGGPFLHNKLFGFFAYETMRNGSEKYFTDAYETPSYEASAPSGSNAAKYMSYPGETVGSVPYSQLSTTCSVALGIADGPYCKTVNGQLDVGSPLTTPLGSYDTTWVSKTKPGVGSGLDGIADLQELTTASPNNTVAAQYYGRGDADITGKDRLSFIVYWVPLNSTLINGVYGRKANLWNDNQVNDAFTALWNHTFSPSLLNEARASASGWRKNDVESNPQVPFGLPKASFSGVGATEPEYFGPPDPGISDQWTYSYQDIVTKIAGGHNLKAGATLTHIEYLDESVANARPSFSFNSFWDFLNDAPYSESGNFNPQTGVPALDRQDDRENIFGVFVQDDYKLASNLTLNLGLRWNYFGPLYAKQGNLSVVTPGQGAAMITGLTMVQAHNLYTVQKDNFGPQLGFAWTPVADRGMLVVRGGFGINYNENEFAVTAGGNSNSPAVLGFSQTGYSSKNPAIQYAVASDIHSPLGFPSNPYAITPFGTNNLPTNTTVRVTGFDQHVKTITVYHYSLDTEYALPAGFVATLGYQGSSGHHLLYNEDLNAVAVAHGYALNPNLSSVSYFANGANSNYNAMLATLKHNFSHTFQIEAQYTWSKSMDEGSDPFNSDAYAPISIHDVYGRSDYNVQNGYRVFGLYQPNFFHEKWLHTFADGWSLGGIYNWHTGFPWTPVFPVTVDGTPSGKSGTLYYVGSPYSSIRPGAYTGHMVSYSTEAFKTAPSPSNPNARNINFPNGGPAYFNEPNYTAVAKGTYKATSVAPAPGLAMERNSFTGPMYQDLDVTLTKSFRLPEERVIGSKAALEFRMDAYNVFNLTNLAPTPKTTITATNFGANTTALGSRTIQLQSRFSF